MSPRSQLSLAEMKAGRQIFYWRSTALIRPAAQKTCRQSKTSVVETTWELSEQEQKKLSSIFPRSNGVTHLTIGRHYKAASRWVGFSELKPIEFDIKSVTSRVRKIKPSRVGRGREA
jgi:hypothetical protein